MEVIYREIASLRKLENNPRTITPEDMERLKESIRNNPDYLEAHPIVLSDRTGELVIIDGNQRYEACIQLGYDEVPTALLHGLTEEREREIIIRANVNNGKWDLDALKGWDADCLEDWGVELPEEWGVLPEMEAIGRQAEEDGFTDEDAKKAESRVMLGEIWQLGEHRLMCADCTCRDMLTKLTNGGVK